MSSRLPPLRDVIKEFTLGARKSLGQNFLISHHLTDKIVRKSVINPESTVIEVGPGPGALTRSLLAACQRVIAVELDQRFVHPLSHLKMAGIGDLQVRIGDMRYVDEASLLEDAGYTSKVNWDGEVPNLAIAGNLPFNVATPLLFKWLRLMGNREGLYQHYGRVPLVLMFQREVGHRILAPPGSRDRGRLSVMCQAVCDVEALVNIKGNTFVPPAKVDATMLQFIPKINPPDFGDYWSLEWTARELFLGRRKTIRRIAKSMPPGVADTMSQVGIDTGLRPGVLSTEDICRLAKALHSQGDIVPKRSPDQGLEDGSEGNEVDLPIAGA